MKTIKWTKNERGILPGLYKGPNVEVGEWSGYDRDGCLIATIHRSQSGKHWVPYVKMDDGGARRL